MQTIYNFRALLRVAAVAAGILIPVGVAAETTAPSSVAVHTPAAADVSMPIVLSPEDVALYQEIFALQETGEWKAADRRIASVENDILMGHVLYQRYMHPRKYRSKYKELKDWMASYADHPSAGRVYKLALKRRPSNWRRPEPPQRLKQASAIQVQPSFKRIHLPTKSQSAEKRRQARDLRNRINRALRRGHTLTAKRYIQQKETKQLLSAAEYDAARARLAKGYFIHGRDEWALEWVLPALQRSGKFLPEGHWTAGLLLWRAERYAEAAYHFEAVATNPRISHWMAASSAFWAARAYTVAGEPAKVTGFLEKAAAHPHTLYGLLAIRVLGRELPFNWTPPRFGAETLQRLTDSPRGTRAMALMQVGEDARAEAELREILRGADREMVEGVHALTARGHMPTLAVRLDAMLYPNGGGFDGAAYPVPPYRPMEGFNVDRALVYALIRQESRFDPNAKSWAGARGLMQLMPRTASFVARSTGIRLRNRNTLYTPEMNLELGQRYIDMLLVEDDVSHNLFKLAVAWNGGPGNLRKWKRQTMYLNDPIFFIESIPSSETRNFIERVLTNYWIYRDRFGQGTPSLDAVARGEWPLYIAQDQSSAEIAQNAPVQ